VTIGARLGEPGDSLVMRSTLPRAKLQHGLGSFRKIARRAQGVGVGQDGRAAPGEGAAVIDMEIGRERIAAPPAAAGSDHRRNAALAT
jgi:hypothetical protein